MGIIRKERKDKQEEAIESPNVWIEDPKGTGQLIIVKQSDLDDEGYLLEEVEEDGV